MVEKDFTKREETHLQMTLHFIIGEAIDLHMLSDLLGSSSCKHRTKSAERSNCKNCTNTKTQSIQRKIILVISTTTSFEVKQHILKDSKNTGQIQIDNHIQHKLLS